MGGEAQFKVRVSKDQLVFSAAHFITFNGNICERLHGHNWRVAVEVGGELDENRYVFDFIALRDVTAEIVAELDHRVLLPTEHAKIRVSSTELEVEARFEERRWVFPQEDCLLLPVVNTTAEEIARWIGRELLSRWTDEQKATLSYLQVEVEENFGQWAICRLDDLQS